MDTATKLLLASQVLTNLLFLLTVWVYFLQWKTMQRQLGAAHEQVRVSQLSVSAQNLFALISYLQEPEARDSRAWVLQRLAGKDYKEWKEEDRDHASRVCSKYDVVGLLVREQLVPLVPVIGSWGPSIKLCHEVLFPFIREMQAKHGPSYWDDFDWLYGRAKATSESGSKGENNEMIEPRH